MSDGRDERGDCEGWRRPWIYRGRQYRAFCYYGRSLPSDISSLRIDNPRARADLSIHSRKARETPTIWAQCLFVDPIADIALLGCPDNQEFPRHANAFESWVDDAVPFSVTELPTEGKDWPARWPARLLSLESEWYGCTLERFGDGPLWVLEPRPPAAHPKGRPCHLCETVRATYRLWHL